MNILYIFTILAIYILFILIHKTEKKQNIMIWLAISAILILCYNIVICIIVSFVGIQCTLQNLSVCNSVVIALQGIILFKNKKIQKYYFKISDLIFSILLLCIVTLTAYSQYGFPFNIKYKTTDGSNHYFFAEQFYENSALLYKEETENILRIEELGFRLPGAYINEGILFKVCDEITENRNLFIIFDLFVLYMSGIMFYYLLKTHTNNNIISAIFSIIYMLGYQLSSMLYGYVYLSLALDIVITLLLSMKICENEQISNKISLMSLCLLSIGIFFSYAYFIPIIYIAIIINIITKTIKQKKEIVSEQNIITLIMTILNPLILGITYFIILPLATGARTEISTLNVDGTIYKNYITNFLMFIPIFIVAMFIILKNRKREEKSLDFSNILFILSIAFALILLIGKMMYIVSEYYFLKAYYIIWPLAILMVCKALNSIYEQENKKLKIITCGYTSMYLIVIVTSTLILNNNIGINDIFYKNKEIIVNANEILENGELKLLEKVKEKIKNNQVYILTPKNLGRTRWLAVLHKNHQIQNEHTFYREITVERWLEEKNQKYYLAYYEDYDEITQDKSYLKQNSDKYKIIHNDEFGFILERK